MHVTYFAPDLYDAAVERRIVMLQRGGATVDVLGFRRNATPLATVGGVKVLDLGQTFDGQLGHRLKQVVRYTLQAQQWRRKIAQSDVLLARNLDMVTIANAARVWANASCPLVYECLDIHGALLGNRAPTKVLRAWERHLLRKSKALIVSSPSYMINYFDHLGAVLPDVMLTENKRILLYPHIIDRPRLPAMTEERRAPWRIGWFGSLRCVESFRVLMGLARRDPPLVDITLRGKPTAEMQALIAKYLPMPSMHFDGPYAQTDLAAIYGDSDFTWAVEYQGQSAENARWALPNRLYEGGFYNKPAFALPGTATGNWLKERQTGLVIDPYTELDDFLTHLTAAQYRKLQETAANVPSSDLVWTTDDCRAFLTRITGMPQRSMTSLAAERAVL